MIACHVMFRSVASKGCRLNILLPKLHQAHMSYTRRIDCLLCSKDMLCTLQAKKGFVVAQTAADTALTAEQEQALDQQQQAASAAADSAAAELMAEEAQA